MTHMLKGLAGGRIILCLEGGYNVTSISYAMTMCTKALLGDPIPHHYEPNPTIHPSAVESINNVIGVHKKYWKNLKFQLALPIEDVIEKPAPSRGLITTDLETSKRLNDSKKSEVDTDLECSLSNLSLKESRCSDGIHCGTDDEDEGSSKKPQLRDEATAPKIKEGSSKINEGVSKVKKSIKDDEIASRVDGGSSNESGGAKINDSEPKVNESVNKVNEPTTLVDFLSENMQAIVDGEMFAVVPLQWCPHLDMLYAIPEGVKFEQGVKCVDCDHTEENWVCLHCYIVSIYSTGYLTPLVQSNNLSLML